MAMDEPLASFLAQLPAKSRALTRATMRAVHAAVPDAQVALRPGWGLIGFDAPRYFAFVFPRPAHADVRLGFEWGVALTAAPELLEGDGRQVRHVTIRSAADAKRPGVTALIREAAALPPRPRAPRARR